MVLSLPIPASMCSLCLDNYFSSLGFCAYCPDFLTKVCRSLQKWKPRVLLHSKMARSIVRAVLECVDRLMDPCNSG